MCFNHDTKWLDNKFPFLLEKGEVRKEELLEYLNNVIIQNKSSVGWAKLQGMSKWRRIGDAVPGILFIKIPLFWFCLENCSKKIKGGASQT